MPPLASWRVAIDAHRSGANIDHCERSKAHVLSCVLPIAQASLKKSWELRDLTTEEYVRCRFDGKVQRGFVASSELWLSVEDALMMRICWSSGSVPHSGLHQNILRSTWAGHCFDVVLAEEELVAMERECWKDVTGDIEKEAKALLKSLNQRAERLGGDTEPYRLALGKAGKMAFGMGLESSF